MTGLQGRHLVKGQGHQTQTHLKDGINVYMCKIFEEDTTNGFLDIEANASMLTDRSLHFSKKKKEENSREKETDFGTTYKSTVLTC